MQAARFEYSDGQSLDSYEMRSRSRGSHKRNSSAHDRRAQKSLSSQPDGALQTPVRSDLPVHLQQGFLEEVKTIVDCIFNRRGQSNYIAALLSLQTRLKHPSSSTNPKDVFNAFEAQIQLYMEKIRIMLVHAVEYEGLLLRKRPSRSFSNDDCKVPLPLKQDRNQLYQNLCDDLHLQARETLDSPDYEQLRSLWGEKVAELSVEPTF